MEIKKFFADNQVDYELKNVREDAEAKKELIQKYKSRGVPTTVIGDQVIVGFKADELKKALDI